MKKYVYLFELDSVRKTDEEIIVGQNALYDEIVTLGHIVVMTYNQVVDSRGFFSLFGNKNYRDALLSLFESGAIRISQYGNVRTVSQYILNSMDSNRKYLYSSLPIKRSQKRLLALMKRCLIYSDLSEIYSYYKEAERLKNQNVESEQAVQNSEISKLFVEVVDDKEYESTMSIYTMANVLGNLYNLLETVLKLSIMHNIYMEPRLKEEYINLNFHNILEVVLNFSSDGHCKLFGSAQKILSGIYQEVCKEDINIDDRSEYIRRLINLKLVSEDKGACQFAQAIVDLCYNYACENSIANISKHYNVDELRYNMPEKPTFSEDFFHRLSDSWNDGKNADARYLTEETNEYIQFIPDKRIPNICNAARFAKYLNDRHEEEKGGESVAIYRYESCINADKRHARSRLVVKIAKRFIFALICLVCVCMLELINDKLNNTIENYTYISGVIAWCNKRWSGITILVSLFLTEIISTFLAKRFPDVLSLSDSLAEMGRMIADVFRICTRKCRVYTSKCKIERGLQENTNKTSPIRNVVTKEMKDYLDFKKHDQAGHFEPSDIYSIVCADNDSELEKLSRCEEITGCRFGIVYKSRYNMMVVDPIKKSDGNCFPYERIIPTNNDGVVVVTKHESKYVLIRQFRHAIRRPQYAFPRGFSNPNCTPLDDVYREIKEELGADVIDIPKFLGRFTPDSGLTSSCVYVYCAEIGNYKLTFGYEGIKEIVELTADELVKWIKEGKIDDGFTLAAIQLMDKVL